MASDKMPPDDPAQSQRFIDMAREVEADESGQGFDAVFGRVSQPSTHKPSDKTVSKILPKTRVSKK
jgi:hypothetical protein